MIKSQIHTTLMKEQTRYTEVQINEEEIGKLPLSAAAPDLRRGVAPLGRA